MNLVTAGNRVNTPISGVPTLSPSVTPSIWQYLSDFVHFLMISAQNPGTVGSLCPSSRFLSKEMVRFVPEKTEKTPRHYLEVGAGRGSFTEEIVKKLKDTDELDIVEIDPQFCASLKKKFEAKNVHVHCKDINDWHPAYKYDSIVAGLPFNNFSSELVQKILNSFNTLANKQGKISYFEYIGLPPVKSKCLQILSKVGIVSKSSFEDFQKIRQIKNDFYKTYGMMDKIVWLNATSARVFHCQNHPKPVIAASC